MSRPNSSNWLNKKNTRLPSSEQILMLRGQMVSTKSRKARKPQCLKKTLSDTGGKYKLHTDAAVNQTRKLLVEVVRLREAERVLQWRCEELELQSSEQGGALRAMEEHMQRLALDTDRRLMQQHRDNQRQIQLLISQLTEMASNGELQEMQERLQHLEKELFFYKSSSRNLKKQLRELSSSTMSTDHFLNLQKTSASGSEGPSTTHIPTTYMRINTTQSQGDQFSPRNSTPSASSQLQESQNSTVHNQTSLRQSNDSPQRSRSGEKLTPVRVHRRDLRQISMFHLQTIRSSTRGQQSIVDASTDTTMVEDSIEVARKSDA